MELPTRLERVGTTRVVRRVLGSIMPQRTSVPTPRKSVRPAPPQIATIDALVDDSQSTPRNAVRLEPTRTTTSESMFEDSPPTPFNRLRREPTQRIHDVLRSPPTHKTCEFLSEDSQPTPRNRVRLEPIQGTTSKALFEDPKPASRHSACVDLTQHKTDDSLIEDSLSTPRSRMHRDNTQRAALDALYEDSKHKQRRKTTSEVLFADSKPTSPQSPQSVRLDTAQRTSDALIEDSRPTPRSRVRLEPTQNATTGVLHEDEKPALCSSVQLETAQRKSGSIIGDSKPRTSQKSSRMESVQKTKSAALAEHLKLGLVRNSRTNTMVPKLIKEVEAGTGPDIPSPHNEPRPPRRRSTIHDTVGGSKRRPSSKLPPQMVMPQDVNSIEDVLGSDLHEASSSSKDSFPPSNSSPKSHLQRRDSPHKKVCEDKNIAGGSLLPALVAKCIDCGTAYTGAAENAKYCLSCGAHRVDNQPFNELFDILANNRVIMRKTALTTFNLKIDNLLQDLKQMKKKSTMKQMMDTSVAFTETLTSQTDSGCTYTQGITREFFPEFIWHVSGILQLTCRSLLEGLLGRAFAASDHNTNGEVPKREVPTREVAKSEVQNHEVPSFKRPIASRGACDHCGCHLISNSNFCCNCGQEQVRQNTVDPNSFHIFKGTKDSLMGLDTDGAPIGEKDFAEMVRLSHAHHVPLDDVRRYWKDFLALGVNADNLLPKERFVAVVRARCDVPQDDDLLLDLLRDDWFIQTPENGEYVDFKAFLEWSLGTEYVEELIVTDPRERHLRHLAREYSLNPNQVDNVKHIFDKCDKNKRGFLDGESFMQAVQHLAREQQGVDLGLSVLKEFWRDLTFKAGKHIDFETFLNWYGPAFYCYRD